MSLAGASSVEEASHLAAFLQAVSSQTVIAGMILTRSDPSKLDDLAKTWLTNFQSILILCFFSLMNIGWRNAP